MRTPQPIRELGGLLVWVWIVLLAVLMIVFAILFVVPYWYLRALWLLVLVRQRWYPQGKCLPQLEGLHRKQHTSSHSVSGSSAQLVGTEPAGPKVQARRTAGL